MDRWLAKLERRFGRYAIPGLTWYLVGAQAIVFVLSMVNPQVIHLLTLDRTAILHGQVWRLVTYLFIPPPVDMIWILFELYWLYLMGTSLEAHWGSFKYNVYWLVGMLFTTALAFALDIQATSVGLIGSLFLAFATLFPDFEILLFLIIPVRVKWLALLDAIGMLGLIIMSPGFYKLVPVVAVGNYLLFFGPTLRDMIRRGAFVAGRSRARKRFGDAAPARAQRVCALCGVTDADPSVEFRVCTCAKCRKPTDFCLAHARKH